MAEKNLFDYDEASIKSLDWREHIRLRPGMYIGKLGDGSSADDGIYVLLHIWNNAWLCTIDVRMSIDS
jgi:topoisomerase-4 subunit B